MVYGIIGMINFAHGEIYMISAYLAAIAIATLAFFGIHSPPVVILGTLVITMMITGFYNWVIERIAYRPLRHSNRLAPLISAIGMSLVLQNYVQISQGAHPQGIPTLIEGEVHLVGPPGTSQLVQVSTIQAIILVIALMSMLLLTFIIQKTSLGQACRTTQQDRKMAEILGINTDRIISTIFVIGAAMAAIAGLLVTMNYGSFDFFIGFIAGIKAFTAAVLGGIGSLPGAMLGGLLLGVSESLFSGFVNTDYKDVFAFLVLIMVLIFRPSGLLGKPVVEKI